MYLAGKSAICASSAVCFGMSHTAAKLAETTQAHIALVSALASLEEATRLGNAVAVRVYAGRVQRLASLVKQSAR